VPSQTARALKSVGLFRSVAASALQQCTGKKILGFDLFCVKQPRSSSAETAINNLITK